MVARRKLLGASLAAAGTGFITVPAAAHEQADNPPEPRQALNRLISGNKRWVRGEPLHRDPAADRRRRVAGGQHPFAVVFSCIDSRVPPEYVFDSDLGDLFVVRTAGQALDQLVTGSLEYGPAHGTPLVFVLGHTSCGAIRATIESIEDGADPPGHLDRVVAAITPAYRLARNSFRPDMSRAERIDATAVAQVRLTVNTLQADPLIVTSGATVTGGRYDLRSGAVTLLPRLV
jgi:carbonic anhydrase